MDSDDLASRSFTSAHSLIALNPPPLVIRSNPGLPFRVSIRSASHTHDQNAKRHGSRVAAAMIPGPLFLGLLTSAPHSTTFQGTAPLRAHREGNGMTDAELVRRAVAGDREAFADLVRMWSPRVLALCHARVRRADVAEDLAQETLLRGFRALHTLNDHAKVGPWLLGIALRACLDWLKASERSTISFSALRPDQPIDDVLAYESPPDYDAVDEQRRLMEEVETLPETFRKVLMLYYYDDFTYRELADLLGVSAATINARLTKARSLLRERMADCRRTTHGL